MGEFKQAVTVGSSSTAIQNGLALTGTVYGLLQLLREVIPSVSDVPEDPAAVCMDHLFILGYLMITYSVDAYFNRRKLKKGDSLDTNFSPGSTFMSVVGGTTGGLLYWGRYFFDADIKNPWLIAASLGIAVLVAATLGIKSSSCQKEETPAESDEEAKLINALPAPALTASEQSWRDWLKYCFCASKKKSRDISPSSDACRLV